MKAKAKSPLPFVIWAVLSFLLAVGGPFGTLEGQTLAERAVYWPGVVALSMVVGRGVRTAIETSLAGLPDLLRKLAVIPVMAAVLGPVLWAYTTFLFPSDYPHPALSVLMFYVFVVTLAVQVLRWAYAQHLIRFGLSGYPAPNLPAASAEAAQPRLVQRLAPELQGDVLRVSARDHYLDIFTAGGRAELLMRFSDALAELDGAEGAQVHRSHWVAWAAVTVAEKDGTRLFLRMTDGARVPVSRRFWPLIEERGLISQG